MPRMDIVESTPQLIARLVHGGGRVLIVGGGIENLPDRLTGHPQLLFWDDNFQGHEHKEVPTNVKVIMWNRWVSHATARRLNEIVIKRRLLKFPMLRPAEIKQLLAQVVQEVTVEDTRKDQMPQEPAEIRPFLMKEDVDLGKIANFRGNVNKFIVQNLDSSVDYKQRGSIAAEAKRLFALAKEAGVNTTLGSVSQGISKILRNSKPASTTLPKQKRAPRPVTLPQASDDFDQLDKLIEDAIAAFRLVQEQMSKVREETERWRGMREKMRALLD